MTSVVHREGLVGSSWTLLLKISISVEIAVEREGWFDLVILGAEAGSVDLKLLSKEWILDPRPILTAPVTVIASPGRFDR